jgi:hypothetical protein
MYVRIVYQDLIINEKRENWRARMSICEKCLEKTCLKTKKPCEAVEKLLRKEGIFSIDYCRKRRETPFSSLSRETRSKLGIDECYGGQDLSKEE